MSPRTLQNWLAEPEGEPEKKLGRPSYAKEIVRRARKAVWKLTKKLGQVASWRTVVDKLTERFPVRLVQRLVARFKRVIERRHRRHLEAARVHVEVNEIDVLWAQDATFLARDEHGEKIWAENVREVASAELLAVDVGGELEGKDVVDLLERLRIERGQLPLVLSTDNGPSYENKDVSAYLAEHLVVHLKNLPHTPQHNSWCERGNGELKKALGIAGGKTVHGIEVVQWQKIAERARRAMNTLMPRVSRGGKTAAKYGQENSAQYDQSFRERFYAAACEAREKALMDMDAGRARKRERRRAEREAIWKTMERFGLIRRTRGDALLGV